MKKHQLLTKQIKKINAELVDGSIVSSDREVLLELKINNQKGEEYHVNAKVLSNMEPDIILGIDFLQNNKARINLETMSFELNKTKYILDKNQDDENMDTKLDEKTRIYKHS